MFPSKEYLTAGRAEFTVRSKVTNRHITYRIKSVTFKDSDRASLLISEKTTVDGRPRYLYVGVLNPLTGFVRLTKGSNRTENNQVVPLTRESLPVKIIDWVMKMVWAGTPIENAEILHSGRCARCGRKLTHPDSLRTGLGPECSSQVKYQSTRVKVEIVPNRPEEIQPIQSILFNS